MRSPMDDLEARLVDLLALLEDCGERYWHLRLSMALGSLQANRLGGISQVLGAFGGEGTLSDLELLTDEATRDPRRHLLANRQLERLRGPLFTLANEISNGVARGS
ncbi:MAG TPA: hypothetical protein VLA56_10075 [Pseudomonadales bacterium]|nr:hypothetical protein [Pseudomonadales bacterium]